MEPIGDFDRQQQEGYEKVCLKLWNCGVIQILTLHPHVQDVPDQCTLTEKLLNKQILENVSCTSSHEWSSSVGKEWVGLLAYTACKVWEFDNDLNFISFLLLFVKSHLDPDRNGNRFLNLCFPGDMQFRVSEWHKNENCTKDSFGSSVPPRFMHNKIFFFLW